MQHNISEEQKRVKELLENNNVIVDSVAGSGKTTCCLYIAQYFNKYNILLLTYNARLKLETRNRIEKLNIENIEAHSYHAFCYKYYNKLTKFDEHIREVINTDSNKIKNFKYDMIIIDESQDLNLLYYNFICKIIKDNNTKNIKICVFGDIRQCIFKFNGSDERYIKFADIMFNFNNITWERCKLSVSFRITREMSNFINDCMLGENFIISNKITGHKPRYLICSDFKEENKSYKENQIFKEIIFYLNLGYKPDEIFILAPSVRGKNNQRKAPIHLLENALKDACFEDLIINPKNKMKNLNIYVPLTDDETLTNDIMQNKLIISTFHQTKGLERKVIIIFNFDETYFKYYSDDNPELCPNIHYVAATRALERITFINSCHKHYLPYLKNMNEINKYCEMVYIAESDIEPINKKEFKYNISESERYVSNSYDVLDLIYRLPDDIITKCYNLLTLETINKPEEKIDIPIQIKNYNNYENVSEITGIAIPSYFEYITKNNMMIYNILSQHMDSIKYVNPYYKNKFKMIDIKNLTQSDILFIANFWNTYTSNYIFKLYQIKNYDWLSKENLDICIEKFKKLNISKNAQFEKSKSCDISIIGNSNFTITINGIVDCVDTIINVAPDSTETIEDNIYEFKCTNDLNKNHYLQLAIYMLINEENKNKTMSAVLSEQSKNSNYYLYNILTNEKIKVKCDYENLKKIINIIIKYKIESKIEITDDNFINNNFIIKNKYQNILNYNIKNNIDLSIDDDFIEEDMDLSEMHESDLFNEELDLSEMYDEFTEILNI